MKIEKFHKNGLVVSCDQRLENLKSTSSGFYCGQCSKNLIDFRGKSKAEFDHITKTQKGGCGVFYDYQINDMTEVELNWRKPLFAFSVLGSMLFSRQGVAQYHSKQDSIVMLDSVSIPKDTVAEVQTELDECDKRKSREVRKEARRERRIRRSTRRVFVSRRFPFIHFRRKCKQIMGFY